MVKILDCTIRDGGYLNNWDFDPACVKASYFAAVRSGVDYFEIGYRCSKEEKGKGQFAYCYDDFLKELLGHPTKCKLAVMIDSSRTDVSLFKPRGEELMVSAVRVATYADTIEKAVEQVEALKEKGYEVFLNLMAFAEFSEDHFKFLSLWRKKEHLEALYFADSFGSLLPEEIPEKVQRLRSLGFKSIGFHPHNNNQMAFANTLSAIKEGTDYVDASVFGMGRGSGNLQIEVLLSYLAKKNKDKYNPVPYLDVIERYYAELNKKIGWGYSMPSFLSGLKAIHPYYTQDIFSRGDYTIDEIWDILDMIKEKCPVSYSTDELNKLLDDRLYVPTKVENSDRMMSMMKEKFIIVHAEDYRKESMFPLENKHKSESFIILANGPSIEKQKVEINKFIKHNNCVVIGVNRIPEEYSPDFHVFISRRRFLSQASFVSKKSVLLVPTFFGRRFVEDNYSGKYIFFEVENAENYEVEILQNSVHKYVNPNVSISAILLAFQMGAVEIYAAGMDGYMDGDRRLAYFYDENGKPEEKELSSLSYELFKKEFMRLNLFLEKKSVHFSIITPTSHKIYFRPLLEVYK